MSVRRLLIGLVTTLAALSIAANLIARAVSLEASRPLIEGRISAALGLEVRIKGDLHLELLPEIQIAAGDVRVANFPGRPSPYLLEIGTLELGLLLFELLRGELSVYRLDLVDVDLHLEPDAEGNLEAPGPLEDLAARERPAQIVPLQVSEIRAENLRVFYRNAAGEPVTSVHFRSIAVREDEGTGEVDIEFAGEFEGGDFQISGRIGPVAELLWPSRPYPISLRGSLLDATIDVAGEIDSLRELRGVDLGFEVTVPDAGHRLRESGLRLPVIGAVRATGRLVGSWDTLGLDALELETLQPDQPVRGHVAGQIRQLRDLSGVKLAIDLEASGGGLLDWIFDRELPEIEGTAFEGTVSDEDGSLGLERGRLRVWARDTVFEASGTYGDIRGMRDVNVALELRSDDLALIGALSGLDRPLPTGVPLRATGRLRDAEERIGLENIVIDIGDEHAAFVRIRGSVEKLWGGPAGVELSARFRDPELRVLEAVLGRDLPLALKIGGIKGFAELADRDGTLGLNRFELHLGGEGTLDIDIEGELDDLLAYDEIDVNVELHAPDTVLLAELLDADLPEIGPLDIEGRVSGDDERIKIAGTAKLARSQLQAEVTARLAGVGRPRFKGRVRSAHLRLADLGLMPEEIQAQMDVTTAAPRQLPAADDALPFDALRSVDLDLRLDLQRVTGAAGLDLRDFRAHLTLEDGDLRLQDLTATYEGGSLSSYLRVDARTSTPTLALAIDGHGIDLKRIAAQWDDDAQAAGLLDLALRLRSRGRTLGELRTSLSGDADIRLSGGTLASRYSRRLMLDLKRAVFPKLGRSPPRPQIGCVRVELAIERGVAEVESLILDAGNVTVEGSGSIDFGRGRYNLTLTPSTTDPALIGAAATVRVTGPLTDPVVRPVVSSLVASAARGAVANLVRRAKTVGKPLSRFTRSTENGSESPDPCDVPLPPPRTADPAAW